jgi:hypothetical protein
MPPDNPPAAPTWQRSFTLHPLTTLDGVLILCTLNGETVATCFGSDEREAAERLAAELAHLIPGGTTEERA